MSNLVKAIRIEQNGGPEVLKLVEIEVPAPADHEITIRQHAAGLNFIDIYFHTIAVLPFVAFKNSPFAFQILFHRPHKSQNYKFE